ncbi:MAG: hypothetical protein Q9160_000306 [Pyrenula sp. 1 TL-2023]
MSGNPFRRKESATTSADSDINRSSERFPALSINASTARSSPKSKTVRIASPEVPTSPYSAYYFSDSAPSSPELSRHPTRSEPPPTRQEQTASNDEASPVDPFNVDGSEEEEQSPAEDVKIAGLNITSTLPTPVTPPKDHGANASADPIRSTLSRFASRPNHPPQSDLNVKPTPRQTMDVDAFKNLLLTGTTGKPSHQPPTSAESTISGQLPPPPHASDSSSNTDTASISHASIFEPSLSNPPLSPDTPRSSHELSPEDADDERSSPQDKAWETYPIRTTADTANAVTVSDPADSPGQRFSAFGRELEQAAPSTSIPRSLGNCSDTDQRDIN